MGFYFFFGPLSSICFALDLKKYGSRNWSTLLIFGIFSDLTSLFLIWNPLFTGIGITILIALSLLFAGLFSIFLAFQLRKIHLSTKDISSNLKERYANLMEEIDNEWKG